MGNQKVREKKKTNIFSGSTSYFSDDFTARSWLCSYGTESRGTDAGFGGSGGSHCYRVGIYMG